MKKITEIIELEKKADYIRKKLVDVSVKNGAGHIAPSLSCVDILTLLYYHVLSLNDDPKWEGRDRLVFSKAHGAYGLYSILADIGYLREEDWNNFYKGSFLKGCIERSPKYGIEAGCGSLGHGMPMAVGIAFGAKIQNKKYQCYCIAGDGETQEGSNWEAVQFAVKYKLNNLIIVVDCNGLQAMDSLDNVLSPVDSYQDLSVKFAAFGCEVMTCDGHNMAELKNIFEKVSELKGDAGPVVILAKTVKGYGIKAMENVVKFHFRVPTKEELAMGVRYER
ncbi:transketolase [Desulfobacula toluolica]|uniref:Transketolase, thiamine diphosphate-binding domain protein n=1 Tax=Desulfobacula toluolica (strain DSM 7467 / Tol2) TaxID=651182 RepID=K0NLP7_DESTT|nr:transketolase [Desulfobacula toluolica]CCK81675.1 transketolase, thiamine diphosphate-binding domain protein [Desulfobacula toluolica Tol2]